MKVFSDCVQLCMCVWCSYAPTSPWTGVWVQAGGPSERCRPALQGLTGGSWYPENRTSCAEAPAPWPPPYRSRSDMSRLALATPSDMNLSGRGGDGGEDAGWHLWPLRLGQPRRNCGLAERKGASEVSSWPLPPTRALTNLLLFSPSADGGRKWEGWRHRKN